MRSLFHSRGEEPAAVIEPVPTVFPKIVGADIAAVFVGKRMAGDFYDSVRVSPQRVLFGLLDVAGRREETRGILLVAQDIFRNSGTELFAGIDINEADAMTELCVRLNRGLLEFSSSVHPCPAFIGCYHEVFGTLCYSNAGHTPGLLCDRTGITELASTGLPFGLFSHATCEAPIVGIEKGAGLLLVSRGVVESADADSTTDHFGLAAVKGFLQCSTSADARSLCSSILGSVEKVSPEDPPRDDRTALALLRTA
jgi:sigma-B regulation protein RsbU (phosphoserine phosphatase)